MARKTFIAIAIILIATFSFSFAIKYFKPAPRQTRNLNEFPLQYNGWYGKIEGMERSTIEMLGPEYYFNATYVNNQGDRVQLFFDYFTRIGSSSGVHSPRNCVPGSGWAILDTQPRQLNINGRIINGNRFILRMGEHRQVMDFWYVTRHGETANDYKFKLYAMISSLTLQPTDVGFIRFVALDSPQSLAALDHFEKSFVPVIYSFLPFE